MDDDEEISRPEWEQRFGTLVATNDASVVDFEIADCDRNGRLSWREYFSSKFKNRHCNLDGILWREATSRTLSAVGADGKRESVVLSGGSPQPPVNSRAYRERPLPAALRDRVRVQCDQARPENRLIFPCTLSNNTEETLSLAILRVRRPESAARGATLHVKTVSIPPRSQAEIEVRLPMVETSAGVRVDLVEVRTR